MPSAQAFDMTSVQRPSGQPMPLPHDFDSDDDRFKYRSDRNGDNEGSRNSAVSEVWFTSHSDAAVRDSIKKALGPKEGLSQNMINEGGRRSSSACSGATLAPGSVQRRSMDGIASGSSAAHPERFSTGGAHVGFMHDPDREFTESTEVFPKHVEMGRPPEVEPL